MSKMTGTAQQLQQVKASLKQLDIPKRALEPIVKIQDESSKVELYARKLRFDLKEFRGFLEHLNSLFKLELESDVIDGASLVGYFDRPLVDTSTKSQLAFLKLIRAQVGKHPKATDLLNPDNVNQRTTDVDGIVWNYTKGTIDGIDCFGANPSSHRVELGEQGRRISLIEMNNTGLVTNVDRGLIQLVESALREAFDYEKFEQELKLEFNPDFFDVAKDDKAERIRRAEMPIGELVQEFIDGGDSAKTIQGVFGPRNDKVDGVFRAPYTRTLAKVFLYLNNARLVHKNRSYRIEKVNSDLDFDESFNIAKYTNDNDTMIVDREGLDAIALDAFDCFSKVDPGEVLDESFADDYYLRFLALESQNKFEKILKQKLKEYSHGDSVGREFNIALVLDLNGKFMLYTFGDPIVIAMDKDRARLDGALDRSLELRQKVKANDHRLSFELKRRPAKKSKPLRPDAKIMAFNFKKRYGNVQIIDKNDVDNLIIAGTDLIGKTTEDYSDFKTRVLDRYMHSVQSSDDRHKTLAEDMVEFADKNRNQTFIIAGKQKASNDARAQGLTLPLLAGGKAEPAGLEGEELEFNGDAEALAGSFIKQLAV